jgi:hypothetical protein
MTTITQWREADGRLARIPCVGKIRAALGKRDTIDSDHRDAGSLCIDEDKEALQDLATGDARVQGAPSV